MNTKSSLIILFSLFVVFSLDAQDTIKVRKEKGPVYTITDESPQYPGGPSVMYKFIGNNVRFPERCKTDSLFSSCKVFLNFIINEDGSLSNIKVLKGCPGFPECDKEGVRVIGLMPKWIPARQAGVAVKYYYNLPLSFKLQ